MTARYNQLTPCKLNSLVSNDGELQYFMQSDAGKQIKQKIAIAVTNYLIMMEELLYMQQNLPELLDDLKAVQEKVDKRHTMQ